MRKVLSIVLLSIICFGFKYSDIPIKNQYLLTTCVKYGKVLAPTYNTRNCVQFMDAVLKNYSPNTITSNVSKKIYINIDIQEVEKRLLRGDSTVVAGVCWALKSNNLATWVKYSNIKPGDIVQYWNNVGTFTNGHCGIIKSVETSGFYIYSSHQDTNGFGSMYVDKPEYSYFVRLK